MGRCLAVGLVLFATACAGASPSDDDGAAGGAPSAPAGASSVPASGGQTAGAGAFGTNATWHLPDTTARAPLRFVCRKDAFCDDFEDPLPGSRWPLIVGDAAAMTFTGPSSTVGARALRVTVPAGGAPAYLALQGAELAGRWAGALGVSLRLDAPVVGVVGGPEIVVRAADASVVARIGIVVSPDGIAVDQRDAGCESTACAARTDLVVVPAPGEFHRVVIGVEANDVTAAPFGRVEVSVDGGDHANLPLVVRPIGGRAEVHAGITEADAVATTMRVDDVMFFTR